MKFPEKYTPDDKVSELEKKTLISNDAYAICEAINELTRAIRGQRK